MDEVESGIKSYRGTSMESGQWMEEEFSWNLVGNLELGMVTRIIPEIEPGMGTVVW